jgi:hypothetical protein
MFTPGGGGITKWQLNVGKELEPESPIAGEVPIESDIVGGTIPGQLTGTIAGEIEDMGVEGILWG